MSPFSRRAACWALGLSVLLTGCGHATPASTPHATTSSSHDSSPEPNASGRSHPRSSPERGDHAPARLLIPDAGVDTSVMPLGLAADRTIEVPPAVAHDTAGWYRYGPTPGEKGPAVVLGHVTTGPHRAGVFQRLERLRRGARIVVRLENGSSARFTVDRLRTVGKDAFPTKEVYGDVPDAQLRLITCGGDRTAAGYDSNVIVFAHRVSAP
ncbi:class F sortase [Streptomyces tsukubensis]|uniref:Class F sortase n=1 Tax=Streptomyces tsukubensis TaxID=83656 RepID=A0A1V4A5E6_9ACTN|nr:class F sortase [Streptomyces tsukubensis]OON76194.1 class F sortase [Streptomyces tsukubensis]QFR93717.1 class F sortase [Streptomyces tsukubensis]